MVYQYPIPALPLKKSLGVFQYPRPRRRGVTLLEPSRGPEDFPEVTGPFYIQGMRARSTEYRVYLALLRMGYRPDAIRFQVGFNGGRNFAGGFVVDFIVRTYPLPTPIWVHGDYWHSSGSQILVDFRQTQKLQEITMGTLAKPVIIWGNEILTEDYAFFTVMDRLGRP